MNHYSCRVLLPILVALITLFALPAGVATAVSAGFSGNRGLAGNDLLEITVAGDTVTVLQAGRSSRRIDLLPGEIVRSVKSRGRVGTVSTSERLLAISAAFYDWQSLVMSPQETTAASYISASLALFTTRERVIFFDSATNRFQSYDLAPGGTVIARALVDEAGVWATADQVGGYALGKGGFAVFSFSSGEIFRTMKVARGQIAAVTSKRVLLFQSETGKWLQQPLPLGDRGI